MLDNDKQKYYQAIILALTKGFSQNLTNLPLDQNIYND